MIYLFTIGNEQHFFYQDDMIFIYDENTHDYSQLHRHHHSFYLYNVKMFNYNLPDKLNMCSIDDDILDCIERYMNKVIFENI